MTKEYKVYKRYFQGSFLDATESIGICTLSTFYADVAENCPDAEFFHIDNVNHEIYIDIKRPKSKTKELIDESYVLEHISKLLDNTDIDIEEVKKIINGYIDEEY